MCDSNDGMVGEFLSDDTLHQSVCSTIDTKGNRSDLSLFGKGMQYQTYLLVASSRIKTVLDRTMARAKQKSCF